MFLNVDGNYGELKSSPNILEVKYYGKDLSASR